MFVINLSNENIVNKKWCFQISKIVSQKNHFGILIYILSWKHLFEIYFRLLKQNNKLKINNFLTNIWRDNWRFNIWCFKRTPLISLYVKNVFCYSLFLVWMLQASELACQDMEGTWIDPSISLPLLRRKNQSEIELESYFWI